MSIPALPAPFVRAKSFEIDDENTFTSPVVPSYAASTGLWTLPTQLVHDQQLGLVAEAVEKLLQQDFAAGSEFDSINIDAALAPDGTTVLNPGFEVTMTEVADLPGSMHIGNFACSVGMAWSFRTLVRVNLGVVVPPVYVP